MPLALRRLASAPIARVADGAINSERSANANGMAPWPPSDPDPPRFPPRLDPPPRRSVRSRVIEKGSCRTHAICPTFSNDLLETLSHGKL